MANYFIDPNKRLPVDPLDQNIVDNMLETRSQVALNLRKETETGKNS